MQNQEKSQYYTNFINKDQFIDLMKHASADLIHSFSEELRYENETLAVTIADGFSYIDLVATQNNWNDVIRKIFLQCWSHAELSVVSSGNIAAYFLAQQFLGAENKTLNELTRKIIPSNKKDSFFSLSQVIESEIYEFVKDVIEFGGINGNISIKKTKAVTPAVELQAGHNFKVGASQDFVSSKEERSEAKIVLFDGVIQEVGEVDRIFMSCHEKKMSCVIVARGFANDVISTINKNYYRETLDVIPVKIDDKIENINIINDMFACVGGQLIDAESGIRLSNIEIDEQPTIRNVVITKRNFMFSLIDENKDRVSSRIQKIKKRINKAHWNDDMSNADVQKVFSARLNSLSSNSIILWVPGNERQHLFIKNRFLFSLNYIAAFANSGTISSKDIFDNHNLPALLPANIVNVSKSLAEKMYLSISNSGGCVAIQ